MTLPYEPTAADALMDDILPAQSVYAAAVIAAEHEYQRAVNEAWRIRKRTIDDALAVCMEAIREKS